jgi:membrane associated rhomboid family serine protease
MNQHRVGGFQMLPPVVKNLLIINGLMFLATMMLQSSFGINLNDILGLHWVGSQKFEIYQVVTYMFMHGSFSHIFFNMFAVWMFGSAIENTWGSKRFLTYYVITGIGAAFLHYVILYFTDIGPVIGLIDQFLNNPSSDTLRALLAEHKFEISKQFHGNMYDMFRNAQPSLQSVADGVGSERDLEKAYTFMNEYRLHFLNLPNVVGASGSLFGLLLAFGMMFPNVRLFLIFLPIPIKAKYFVIGYGLIEFVSGIMNSPGDNVAHFAHLGGMLFGYILIKIWQNRNQSNSFNDYY